MKKKILILALFLLCNSVFTFSQKYQDLFYLKNETNDTIIVTFSYSTQLEKVLYGYRVYIDDYDIYASNGSIEEFSPLKIKLYERYAFWYSNYRHEEYVSMSPYEKFMIMVGEFTITTEDGTVLMSLETLTEDDFAIKQEDGITEATIVVRGVRKNK